MFYEWKKFLACSAPNIENPDNLMPLGRLERNQTSGGVRLEQTPFLPEIGHIIGVSHDEVATSKL